MARNGEDDVKARGKYALFQVPSHGVCPDRGTEQTTYVRMGAASSSVEQDAGGDLLTGAGTAGWKSDPGRAGWRDHSDGDRFSTTRGNKIDVVSGNYKRVWQSDGGKKGSIREDVERRGDVLVVTSQKESVVEKTQQSGQYEYEFVGPKYKFTRGKPGAPVLSGTMMRGLWQQAKKEEQAQKEEGEELPDLYADEEGGGGGGEGGGGGGGEGAEGGDAGAEEEGGTTWSFGGPVGDLAAMAGAPALSVSGPLVASEETYAVFSQSKSKIAVSESEEMLGKSSSLTLAGLVTEESWVGQSHSVTNVLQSFEITNAITTTSTTNVGVANETTVAGVMNGLTMAGLVTETSIVPQTVSTTVGNTLELAVGDKIGVTVGNNIELTAATNLSLSASLDLELKMAASISLALAASLEVALSAKMEVTVGTSLEVTVGPTYEAASSDTVDLMAGPKTETAPQITFMVLLFNVP